MPKNRFGYLLLIIFLVSILLIVFLQFNSGKSIESLIAGNTKLLHELQVKTQLQKFETDIIFIETNIRGFVITEDTAHLEGVKEQINNIRPELDDVITSIKGNTSSGLLQQLSFLTDEKIQHSHEVLETFYKKGKTAAEAVINTNRGKIMRDSIINIVNKISMNRQIELSGVSVSVNTNGARAKKWGIVLALVACFASIIAFWYLINQGQRQRKLIQTLDTSEKKLKEASKIKEQFVANISHEIRTPMNGILGFTGLLQKTALDKNQHEYVKSIRSSAENLLTIINDILDLSRIESGMMRIEKVPFNIRELLDSLATMLNAKAKNIGLYLHTQVDNSIPEILEGDAGRLTQILMNLIGNALKFTHEGGITVKVQDAERKMDTIYLRILISDTGIGIDREKQQAIFERFQQAEAETSRRYGGTGLGLSIVKQLIDLQNGSISVESEVGKGSVFTVLVPYHIPSDAEASAAATFSVPLYEPLQQNIKILVAEDNPMNRKLIKYLLEQWNIDFDIVTNGIEAVKSLQQKSVDYDLVLMDIQMPELDGYAATEKIRFELNLQIPIIAMTAHALAGEKEKCLGAGMDDYISKPLNEEQLYKLINKHARKENGNMASPFIDLAYLKSLSKGDEEFEKNMVRSFSQQVPEELNDLKMAIGQKDYVRVRAIAHTMKSTVSFLGLQKLAPLLQQLEQDAENKRDFTEIQNKFELINTICQAAIREAGLLISS
jgi:signal transduction histidine kinase/CheY-like chemotaxis protein